MRVWKYRSGKHPVGLLSVLLTRWSISKAAAEATARAAVEAKAKVDTAAAAASEKAAAEKEFELSITSRPEAGTSSAQSGRYDSLLDTSLISPTRP